jgi:FecR protein
VNDRRVARLATLIALVAALGGASTAAAQDRFVDTWTTTPYASTPWADGEYTMTIRASSRDEVAAFQAGITGHGAQDLKAFCLGAPGEPPPSDNPGIAYYAATYTWSGGGLMMGCTSLRSSGHDLLLYASGEIRGDFNFATVSGEERLGGVWGDQPGFQWQTSLRRGAGIFATLSGLHRTVEVQVQGGTWQPAAAGMRIRSGDRIHTGFRASVRVTLPDGSTLDVGPMSLLSIESLGLAANGTLEGSVFLRLGETKAQINRVRGNAADFVVKTPTSAASIRGTKLDVLYDGSKTLVAVTSGSVSVDPKKGKAVLVKAGHEVFGDSRSAGRVVGLGKAGTPAGSVGPKKALSLIASFLKKGVAGCKVEPYSTKLRVAKGGWRATLKIVGALSGSATLRISGRKVSASNKLAKRVRAGCR